MAQIIVGSVLGLAGAVVGAVVAHFLQRTQVRQQFELERAKVFADRRVDAYVQFRHLAEQISMQLNRAARGDSAPEEAADREQLIDQLREAEIVIDAIGDPAVAVAARRLRRAFEAPPEGEDMGFLTLPTPEQMVQRRDAVGAYVDAVRTSLGVEQLDRRAEAEAAGRPRRRAVTEPRLRRIRVAPRPPPPP